MQSNRPHIVIADDYTFMSDACKKLLEPKYDVVATVGDERALVRIAATLKSGFAEHRMAPFPPHVGRLGERGRVGTGRCQNPIASQEHRNHLGDLWGFGPRSEPTDSAKADQFRRRAGSRHYSVKDR